ncbi:dr1-associated corepressor [Boleophthalmus pectinirostris]|uniref:dr1-associated corepressor n=1 Tax=Boleophthalmus pectinirostris TaxID=150288 RepID=UPI002432A279|nr:dr1-associated corepressor [Boleophthalmus pectinirostris]
MPGQKRRYSVRFPPGRVKKIMQKDTEVGRIAMAVPVLISRALEMFLKALLTKTFLITQSKLSTVLSVAHMRQCIESERLFHFLLDLLEQMSTAQKKDPKNMSIWPLYRSSHHENSVKKPTEPFYRLSHHEIPVKKKPEVKETAPRQSLDSLNDDYDSSEPELVICL